MRNGKHQDDAQQNSIQVESTQHEGKSMGSLKHESKRARSTQYEGNSIGSQQQEGKPAGSTRQDSRTVVSGYDDYDKDQQNEIEMGIKAGLDISYYDDRAYLAIQMRQIRLGLEKGLDVSVYASKEYDWFQMEEIRLGMEEGINYRAYANPSIEYNKMREIRKGYQEGIDLSNFTYLEAGILRELRKSVKAEVSIIEYINNGYDEEQLRQIRLGLEKGLPVEPFLNKEFRGVAISQICQGLENGIDPSTYANIELDWKQMRQIRLGLEHRVDVEQYNNCMFSWQQMQELRLGLEEGLDITPYRSFIYMSSDMKNIRERMLKEAERMSEGKSYDDIASDTAAAQDTRTVQGTLATEVSSYKSGYTDRLDITNRGETTAWESTGKRINLTISTDEMSASVEVICKKDATITSDEVIGVLKYNRVKEGILRDAIDELVEKKIYNQPVVIAKGRKPIDGKDGYYEFLFKTDIDSEPEILEDGSADYKAMRHFEKVEVGQNVALYHPAEYGTGGYTVTGRFLPSRRGKEKPVLTGKGFYSLMDGTTYVALMSGVVRLIGDYVIEISKMCILDQVTLATGNVDFNGNILVEGDVGSGTQIHATGDVYVNGIVESAKIFCDGEVFIRGGVHGAGDSIIEAGKRVIGSFFEYTKVTSGGDIEANYCLNCQLQAAERIVIHGKKGTIAGGVARAGKGIEAYNVGNRVKLPTVLRLGENDSVNRRRAVAEQQIKEINSELAILNNAYINYQHKYTAEVRNAMDIYIKIENAIYTKELELGEVNKIIQECDKSNEASSEARAIIRGDIYEGTTVFINGTKLTPGTVRDVTVKKVRNKVVLTPN